MKYLLILSVLMLSSCATISPSSAVLPPQINSIQPVSNYHLAIIQEGKTIHSTIVTNTVGYNISTSPASLIAGALTKHGVTRIYEVPKTNKDKLLLVTWGISGSRAIGMIGSYAQEVSILIRQSDNLKPVYKCTAEGIGKTEADDIRKAVFSCLSGLK